MIDTDTGVQCQIRPPWACSDANIDEAIRKVTIVEAMCGTPTDPVVRLLDST
jgi:hypothetical protein